jgi:hypothetical protein
VLLILKGFFKHTDMRKDFVFSKIVCSSWLPSHNSATAKSSRSKSLLVVWLLGGCCYILDLARQGRYASFLALLDNHHYLSVVPYMHFSWAEVAGVDQV